MRRLALTALAALRRGERRDIGLRHWVRVTKFDPDACALADRHYSRRKPGSPQFMPPGQTVALLSRDGSAVWGWWRPDPASGLPSMNGLDGWTCCIFRNEGATRSSDLILDAEAALPALGYDCGASGFITYVWVAKVKPGNPGWCYQKAGWLKTGWSADRRKRLLQKPYELAGRVDFQCDAWDALRPEREDILCVA